MITFKRNNKRFTYRVAGVAIHEGKILLQESIRKDYWFLPGGRNEMLEPSETTLVREMKEELNATALIDRLLIVTENFFMDQGEVPHHEVGMYYLMHFKEALHQEEILYGVEENLSVPMLFKWFPIEKLDEINLKPDFLVSELMSIGNEVKHIVHNTLV